MCRCGTSRLLVAAPGAPAKGAAKSTSVRPHASPRRAAAPTWGCTSYAALVRRCAAASCWGGPSCAASVCLWVCAAMHSPRKAFWQSPCHLLSSALRSHHTIGFRLPVALCVAHIFRQSCLLCVCRRLPTSYAVFVRRCAAASCWGGPRCAASVCACPVAHTSCIACCQSRVLCACPS